MDHLVGMKEIQGLQALIREKTNVRVKIYDMISSHEKGNGSTRSPFYGNGEEWQNTVLSREELAAPTLLESRLSRGMHISASERETSIAATDCPLQTLAE